MRHAGPLPKLLHHGKRTPLNARIPARPGRSSAAVIAANVVRPEIQALSAYAVPDAQGLIKLDAMENPYPLPAEVRAEMAAAVADVAVNRYPDAAAQALRAALRSTYGIPDSLGILLGNGSDELIQTITFAIARPGVAVLAPEPSFVMYRMDALFAGVRFVGVPLGEDFALDTPAMLGAIERERPAVVFLAYPNNPTGNLFARAEVEKIIAAAPGLVVIDEAYYAFATDSFLPAVGEFPNLLVLRTTSKIGMAGLRLGYAVAAPAWIEAFNKLRQPYNVNALTQAVVPVLLGHAGLLEAQARAIRDERARLQAALAALARVRVHPSEANFVLARVPDADGWHAALKSAGILVKNLNGTHPLLANCLRVTVGTPAENDALLAVLRKLA